ncbi:ABC transporter permease [Paenibacillus sp. URB8-2]|uniref:ABC transporter permease n=1 Tax=Paenibacillus sp. URB8-2 TaxID=2741301 RepID=UPI0015C038AD|nr:ABC transporter permease [Paenibacillus sp. URB8-2]BCG61640.1 polyamine ABC transporter permease [Paenibacillus sp. URB8-2]
MKRKFRLLNLVNGIIYLFIMAPLIVIIISSFNPGEYLVFPPKGFTFRWYEEVLTGGRYGKPFWTSLWLAILTTCVALPIGTMIAYALARFNFRFKNALQSLFLSPLVIPTLLFGIGLLIYFSSLGVKMYFMRLLLAHIVLVIPYVIRMMLAGFSRMERSVEEAAIILGASPVKTFFLVTLPLAKPALAASAFISLVMSFDELVIALFLTGPGVNTLPMTIYSDIQFNLSPSLAAVSSIIIVCTFLIGLLGAFVMKRNNRF